jgi:hypothetical protein
MNRPEGSGASKTATGKREDLSHFTGFPVASLLTILILLEGSPITLLQMMGIIFGHLSRFPAMALGESLLTPL